jgi:hypothetical protein
MIETFNIRVLLPNRTLDSVAVRVVSTSPGGLLVSGLGFRDQKFTGSDLFNALLELRRELEQAGHRLLCGGARTDVFPSGMSRSMGGGRKVYVMSLGQPATHTIDIFDDAEPAAVGTIMQQKEFHERWIQSLIKLMPK